jgi:hypothetical protein
MNLFYLHKDPVQSAEMHCDKHVVKMIIEYAQMLSTAHRMLDGTQYTDASSGRRIQRWRLDNSNMDGVLYKASHINHPSTRWVRENAIQYQYAYDMFTALCDEYTYRYGKIHLTDTKLRDLLNEIPNNITLGSYSEPPQCMPEDVKVQNDSISAYHKYYQEYKKDFAVWTARPTPEFMYADL